MHARAAAAPAGLRKGRICAQAKLGRRLSWITRRAPGGRGKSALGQLSALWQKPGRRLSAGAPLPPDQSLGIRPPSASTTSAAFAFILDTAALMTLWGMPMATRLRRALKAIRDSLAGADCAAMRRLTSAQRKKSRGFKSGEYLGKVIGLILSPRLGSTDRSRSTGAQAASSEERAATGGPIARRGPSRRETSRARRWIAD